jgi:phosphoribosylglycinamide formyltransferase 1
MKLVVCVSGGGTNLQSLIDAKAEGRLPEAEPVLVIASRDKVYALERASRAEIPSQVIRRKDFLTQDDYDFAMIEAIDKACAGDSDVLIVLAGFLTKLGPRFVKHYQGRIMNIHPSLLPAFGGQGFYGIRPHEAVLEYGCKITGATVHIVDEAYDHGPIVAQKAVEVLADDTAETLQKRVMEEAEQVLMPRCVDLYTRGKIIIENGKANIVN